MKIPKVVLWFGSLLLIAIVSGCVQSVQSTPTLSPVIPTAPATVTIATKMTTPPLIFSATSTPVPATPTDVPALPVDDARQRLLKLLANNGNCQLPCLWGITPGKSTSLDARFVLLPLRGIAETAYFDLDSPDSSSPFYIEDSQRLYTRIAYFYNANGVIGGIHFRALEEELVLQRKVRSEKFQLSEFFLAV